MRRDPREEADEQLRAAVATLTPVQRFVMTRLSGLDGKRAQTEEEIARELCSTVPRVRGIQAKARARLLRRSEVHAALVTLTGGPPRRIGERSLV